jgi:hypothetical protein
MPLVKDCPICKQEKANFGFDICLGGIRLWHGDNNCTHWQGNSKAIYTSELDFFHYEVIPDLPKTVANSYWIKGRICDINGDRQKAEYWFDRWSNE